MKKWNWTAFYWLLCSITWIQTCELCAQSTAFTYQGRLNNGANPATGIYDLRFAIYDTPSAGTQQGVTRTNAATAVTNGLFIVTLDFGNQFPGADRWLEIAVRTNGNATFSTLTPRQPLTPTPYAIQSLNSGSALVAASANSVAAANVTGSLQLAQLPGAVLTNNATGASLNGSFTGNGAGVTNVNLSSINSGGVIMWPGNFAMASRPSVGNEPYSVCAADVNGDGKVDLISANYSDNTLTVLTNNGSGGFALASSPGAGLQPISVCAADVNGDGKVDLISANEVANTLTILTNNGSGGFLLASSPGVGIQPLSVCAADVNGDGKVDLISANAGAGTLTILTNNGSGGFALASSPGVGDGPYSVCATDVNSDGKMDLISANKFANTLTILTNNGSGGFALASSPGVDAEPYSVCAADVNGDGKVDLISANGDFRYPSSLTVLTNNASGGFAVASSLSLDVPFHSVCTADVNGDGKVDLITANYGLNVLKILTNNGSGGFALASSPGVDGGPYSVCVADVNGDGKVDLITANLDDSTLAVLLNTPNFNGIFYGDGSALNSLNASNITSGTLGLARLPGAVVTNNATGVSLTGSFTGNGGGLTNLNAANLVGSINAAQLPAVLVTNGQSGVSLSGTFTGNGAGVTNVNAATLSGISSAGFWKTNGNAGANPTNGAFLGTADNLPLEFKVNTNRALRLEYAFDNIYSLPAPNIIGGSAANVVSNGSFGCLIGGGGNTFYPNRAGGRYASVVGGMGNTASGDYSTAAGGGTIASGLYSTAMGGGTTASGSCSTALGGFTTAMGVSSTALGSYSIAGGANSTALGAGAVAIGDFSTAVGNDTTAVGNSSIAMGNNTVAIGDNSVAAGYYSQATNQGAFIWADATSSTPFTTTANNQFLIRAAGGVGINTNNPGGAALNINGTVVAINYAGNGGGLTNLNAANLVGSVNAAQLPAGLVTNGQSGLTLAGTFTGSGSGLNSLNATNLVGTIVDARLSTNVALLNSPQTFTSQNIFAANVGINTNNPQAPLHVRGNVLVDGADRVQFKATKTELSSNSAASGFLSVAMAGGNASGQQSVAAGASVASGMQASAFGNSLASGDGSFAASLGQATNLYATAFGVGLAGGWLATALGAGTASGSLSVAMGDSTTASGYAATAIGGYTIASGSNSLAAGYNAQAIHPGTFVWADQQATTFASTGTNQFLIRAAGGVGIGTASPSKPLVVQKRSQFEPAIMVGGAMPGGPRIQTYGLDADPNAWMGLGSDMSGGPYEHSLYFPVGNNNGKFTIGSYSGGTNYSTKLSVDVNGNIRWGNGSLLSSDPNGIIELGSPSSSAQQPIIDFHFGVGSIQDYNVRMINDANETLSIFRLSSGTPMARLNSGGLTVNGTVTCTTLIQTSDRNLKENFQPVNAQEVLRKVAALPLSRWNYKADQSQQQHVGPMAQDFYSAFNVGPDDKHITTIDESGVALAAIQGLNQKLEEQKAENAAKNAEINDLKQQLADLKALVEKLAQPN